MFLMYSLSMGTSIADGGWAIGTFATDWTNDVLFGEIVPGALGGFLESIGVAGWLYGLIMDGIVAGVGAVLGFVPQCDPRWCSTGSWRARPCPRRHLRRRWT